MLFLVGVGVSVLIGVSLGLLGGGGSILTVPTIHYVFGVEAHAAITSSLLIVGVTSLVALVPHLRARRVRGRIGLVFGGASMLSAYGAGRLSRLVSPTVLLIAFGAMMVVAAVAMLRPRTREAPPRASLVALVVQGLAVGAVTGFVGAGGGFVIVPALVVIVGLSMPEAVATSLLVIAMNSFVAFGATVGAVALDGRVIAAVLIAAIAGGAAGGMVAGRVPAARLRRGFGWFVLAMAAVVLGTELARLIV
ncbi:MAG: sulfite exporter TauE/SafE family protein [Deltaproteobacteria bacterium]|nr:sulfite exporter TauE/SafE family protein [Deltaproteobacteria bacterium]